MVSLEIPGRCPLVTVNIEIILSPDIYIRARDIRALSMSLLSVAPGDREIMLVFRAFSGCILGCSCQCLCPPMVSFK